jgi:hypothetical protein
MTKMKWHAWKHNLKHQVIDRRVDGLRHIVCGRCFPQSDGDRSCASPLAARGILRLAPGRTFRVAFVARYAVRALLDASGPFHSRGDRGFQGATVIAI